MVYLFKWFFQWEGDRHDVFKTCFFFFNSFFVLGSAIDFPSVTDRAIGRLPVLHEGRIKPFDTLSRHYLLQIQGRLRLPNNQTPRSGYFQ